MALQKTTSDEAPSPDGPTVDDYEALIKKGVTDPEPYHRLMVTYRKEKRYDDELRVVKRAISVFQDHLARFQKGILKGHRKRASILTLSQKISKQTGLVDKKGNAQHIPEPIAGWMKRQEGIEKKLSKKKK